MSLEEVVFEWGVDGPPLARTLYGRVMTPVEMGEAQHAKDCWIVFHCMCKELAHRPELNVVGGHVEQFGIVSGGWMKPSTQDRLTVIYLHTEAKL